MLPKIPYAMEKNKSQIVQFRGINYSDMRSDGDLSDSFGISLRRFPYLTNKKGREAMGQITGKEIKAFTVYSGKLLCIDDESDIYYDGKPIDVCSTTTPQLVTVGNKVVIFPDKAYVDFSEENLVVKDLESELSGNVTFGGSTLTFAGRAATPYTLAGTSISSDGSDYTLKVKKREVLRKYEGDNYLCVLSVENKLRLYRAKMYDINTWFDESGILCVHADGFPFKKGDAVIVYDVLTEDCRSREIEFLTDGGYDAYGKKFYKVVFGQHSWHHTQSGYIKLGKSDNNFGESRAVSLEVTRYGYTNQDIIYGKVAYSNGISTFTKADESSAVDFTAGIYHGRITNAGLRPKFNTYLTAERKFTIKQGNETHNCTVKSSTDYSVQFKADTTITTGTPEWITVTADEAEGLDKYFSVGDCVEITGAKYNNTSFVIDKIEGQVLYASAEIFNTETETANVTVARRVPALDFICENHNRLFGCSNGDKTIYVSALGDPTNMYAYEGVATDSFAVAVPGEGDFTACIRHDTSVLFFKEDKIYKLAGSYPAEFALYSYEVPGVQAGSEKSCVLINEVLYYKGVRGIYAYDGSIPVLISECFGEREFYNACAGSDGVNYYVSMNDDPDSEKGSWYLFAYNTQKGIWMLEEKGIRVVGSARISNELYFLRDDGKIYHENAKSDVTDSKWLVRFAPIYELIDGKRCYSRILARVSLPRGSYIIVKIRCDGGEWREAGKIVGKTEAVVPIRIPINRCDKFELELSGRGECTILDIMREFHVGSEV